MTAEQRKAGYTAVVGPHNSDRYLRLFQRFDTCSGAAGFLSWNWSAFLCTAAWLGYRRMHRIALIYAAAYVPLCLLLPYALAQSCPGEIAIVPALMLVIWVVLALLVMPAIADWLYYRHVRRACAGISAGHNAVKTGTSALGATSALLVLTIAPLNFAYVAAHLRPYNHREAMSAVVAAAAALRTPVQAYHLERGRLPGRGDIELDIADPANVKSLAVGNSGIITAVANLRCFQGKSLVFTPSVAPDKVMTWRCSTPDIDFRYLPVECRQRQ